MFRKLKADEIECRIQSIKEGKKAAQNTDEKPVYVTCLLYKDARCDMRILDETVGSCNWQRRHDEHRGNLFCSVGININYSDPSVDPVWTWKEDAGSESNQEAEKGHASDSFKRACFNWGIGRELYTAPFIFFQLQKDEYYQSGGIFKSNARFYVTGIQYDGDAICELEVSDRRGEARFRWRRK